ncbi:hypothetical protein V8F33_007090 [Rhypophila sp. PSN 637]
MIQILAQDDSCALPDNFTISYFLAFTPDTTSGNQNGPLVHFGYQDIATSISTMCMYNTSSVNVGPEGLTPRYACDNEMVQFIWDSEEVSLTVVEKACSNSLTASLSISNMEAAGSVTPTLYCGQTPADSLEGKGTFCYAEGELDGDFSSMSPAPPS